MRTIITTLALLTVLAAPQTVRAQRGQQASLAGTVTDATGAVLAGAVVTITSPQSIGGPVTVSTDVRGQYRMAALLPGIYVVAASYPGLTTMTREQVEVGAGLEVTVDLRLPVEGRDVTVQVEGVAPAVDVRSAAWPATVPRSYLEQAPVPLSRSVLEVVEVVPGISRAVAWGGPAGVMKLSRDGTDSNDPSIGFADAGPRINWIDSIQVVSVGAPAEYGEFTNARINVVTRSGSNRYSGLTEAWTTGSRWTQSNRGSLPAGAFTPQETLEWWNAAAQVGGPVRLDRVWFFGGVDVYRQAVRAFGFTGPRTADEPAFTQQEPRGLAKLSAAPANGLRLEGFVERLDGRTRNDNAGPNVSTEARSSSEYPQAFYNARSTWQVSARTLVEARYGGFNARRTSGPATEAGRNGPAPHRDQATQVNSVNVQSFGETVSRVHAGSLVLTQQIGGTAGRGHELRAGLEVERTSRVQEQRYPGDMLFLDRDGQPELVWIWPGAIWRPSFRRTSLFVQDTWRVTDRVTVQPGLRLSMYRTAVPDTDARLYENEALSPRLGIAWDLDRSHRTVARAHYGHYHEGMYTGLVADFDPLAQAPTITARVIGPGQFEEVSRTAISSASLTFDPDARHMYAQEITAGVEHEFRPRWTVTMQYVRRNTRNALGYVDTGTTWTPTVVTDPGRDGRVGTADDGGPLTLFFDNRQTAPTYVVTNPAGAWRHYDGLSFVVNRRFAGGWSLQGSYTWAWTRGNFDNDAASNAASSDLAPNGNFANPNRAINSTGRTVYDRRHDAKVYGTWATPFWKVCLTGVYRYLSGAPFARVVNAFGAQTGAFSINVEPVGAYQLPAQHGGDLRVDKTVRLAGAVRAEVFVDVFNVTNQGIPFQINNASGSAFGQPRSWSAPRQFRGGVRVLF